MLVPVVLAGGVGSRLWPLSTPSMPKQFVVLPNRTRSLFTETVLRFQQLSIDLPPPIVVCNHAHRALAQEQLNSTNNQEARLLLEPLGRNTAPAVALAAFHASREGADPLLLVCPSDHAIQDNAAFSKAVKSSIRLADAGKLVTFGITPTRPETAYGYIECGGPLDDVDSYEVVSFIEKPTKEIAQVLIGSKRHLWNSGMFVFKTSIFLKQLQEFAPDIFRACLETSNSSVGFEREISYDTNCFEQSPNESIDRAVMEHTKSAAVIEVEMGWKDLGSWDALNSEAQDQGD